MQLFRRKNRKDPNPDRKGKAINVATEETKKDHEFSMARSELATIRNAAKRLDKKMGKKGEGELKSFGFSPKSQKQQTTLILLLTMLLMRKIL